jgi:tetratricopeptide (TPR) repeat protein
MAPSVEALAHEAQAALTQENWPAAVAALEALISALPQPPAPLIYNLGLAYRRMGSADLSIQWLQRALDIDDTHSNARFELASVLLDAQRFAEAAIHFETYLGVIPLDGDAILNLAQCRVGTGLLAEAADGLGALAASGDADAAILQLRLHAELQRETLLADARHLMLAHPERRAEILTALSHASRGVLPWRTADLLAPSGLS